MARFWGKATQSPETPPRRPARHGRHGRVGRSAVVRPPLPPLDSRFDRFEIAVSGAAEFLRSAWPELIEVRYEMGAMPEHIPDPSDPHGVPRWWTNTAQKRIVLYRLPIERLSRLHRDDDLHKRMAIEACVFRASAEYLGRNPWDLGRDHFHF